MRLAPIRIDPGEGTSLWTTSRASALAGHTIRAEPTFNDAARMSDKTHSRTHRRPISPTGTDLRRRPTWIVNRALNLLDERRRTVTLEFCA